MNLQQIYKLAIELGIKNDLRGATKVKENLAKTKKRYDNLSAEKKADFDLEKLTNPYSDTRILVDNGQPIKKVLVGIDMESAEILLAKQLGIDTVISHHPVGAALADLSDVMNLQSEVLAMYGVPINVAEALTKERISEVSNKVSVSNDYQTVDVAKILGINFICVHTPCDNLVAMFLKNLLAKHKLETVGEILAVLKTVPEYQEAAKRKAGPKILVGNEDRYAGKIVLTEITGGTEGAVGIYEKMSQAGIGTVVGMHLDEEHKREAQKNHLNIIIAGHISSDSVGVNLFLDELEKKGIEILPCSGLIRISRVKNNKKAKR